MTKAACARWIVCLLLIACAAWQVAAQSPSRHGLLLVSIDGLVPAYVIDADRYGLKIPALRRILRDGAYAQGVRGVLPTVTYPNHTTLITGVGPAAHGIFQNTVFDPMGRNDVGWYWYSEDIRVPTLWDAATQAGYSVGSVSWPVSVGARHVQWLIPEFWRAGTSEDLKLLAVMSTPGLLRELEHEVGPYSTDINGGVQTDWQRARYAEAIVRDKHARFMTVHLAALDHLEHETGPFSTESLATIEAIDQMVARLEHAMLTEDPQSTICIVSDHGFARSMHQLNLREAFVRAGLMTVDPARPGTVTDWAAAPWTSGGGALSVVKDRKDSATRDKVQVLLRQLAADPGNGIEQILDRPAMATFGATAYADFFVDMQSGFDIGNALGVPLVREIALHGDHGFSPSHPEMRAAFFVAGPGIRPGRNLGEIDMRSIAPTLAKLLGAALPSAPLPALDLFSPDSR